MELLAVCHSHGGMAERSKAAGLEPADGALTPPMGSNPFPAARNTVRPPRKIFAGR